MDTTQLLKGVLDLAVLAVVDDEDGYGYDIVRRLRDCGLEDIGDASVYGTLRRLYAGGALTSYVVASQTGGPIASTTASRPPGAPSSSSRATTGRPSPPPSPGSCRELRRDRVEEPVRARTDPPVAREVVLDKRGEVRSLVVAVRARLADLSEEEREELVAGLNADLIDLVAERGLDALPEPVAYATELRSAAGFSPEPVALTEAPRVTFGQRVTTVLDRGHERWEGFAGGLPGSPWEFLVALRPDWWVLRA